jgi:predicted LPLAT superfamily acyltransferase
MVVKPQTAAPRNPGPSWGYGALCIMDRIVPEVLFKPLRACGTWVAVATMPAQRGYSKAYLGIVLGRKARIVDVFRHFFAVSEALMLRLRVAHGAPHVCEFGPGSSDFARWLGSSNPGLLGTFHIGDSDLTGFMLAGQENKRVHIIRMRVGNSHDVDALSARFGDKLSFVWVNEPGDLLFALKEAGSGNEAVALQCDRPDHSSRSEEFDFLGAKRKFPFTIYHLSLIFGRPVLLSFGTPGAKGKSVVHASPAFVPVEGEPRPEALQRAREHFQHFLARVEAHLRTRPYEWLNFLPL